MGRVKHGDHCSAAARLRRLQCNSKATRVWRMRTCLYNVRSGAARPRSKPRVFPVFAHADFRSVRPVRQPHPSVCAHGRRRRRLHRACVRAARACPQETPQGRTQDRRRVARRARGRPAGVRAGRAAARERAGIRDQRRRRARRRPRAADRVERQPADAAGVDDEAGHDVLRPVDPRPRLPLAHHRVRGRADRPGRHAAGQPVHQGTGDPKLVPKS